MPKNPVSWLFALYGGCNRILLEKAATYEEKEHKGYTTQARGFLGFVLFTVVLVSSAMAGFAWLTITTSPAIAAGIGVGWFGLFSIIDRALMQTLDGRIWQGSLKQKAATTLLLVVRLLVIVFVAGFNATAVNQVIFAPEIDKVVATRASSLIGPAIERSRKAEEAYQKWGVTWNDFFTKEANAKQTWVQAGNAVRAAEIQANIDSKTALHQEEKNSGPIAVEREAAKKHLDEVRAQAVTPHRVLRPQQDLG